MVFSLTSVIQLVTWKLERVVKEPVSNFQRSVFSSQRGGGVAGSSEIQRRIRVLR